MDAVKTEIWLNLLQDLPFERASSNLREHIRTNAFVPTPADIIGQKDPEAFTDYNRMRLETAERKAELQEWKQLAIDCPDRLLLKGGDNK